MKKLSNVLGIALLGALLIVPGIAGAHGWGMGGGHMMDYWGGGPGYYDQGRRDYATPTSEQQEQLAELDRKFYEDTRDLRNKLWSKSEELNTLFSEKNPDTGKIGKLQKEISDLRSKLDEKVLYHEIEARKIVPEDRFGGGYGMGYGMMGYGPGACLN